MVQVVFTHSVKSSASLFFYEHLNVYHLSPSGIWGRGLWLRCTAERHCSYEPPMGFRTSPAWSRQPRRSLMSSRRPRWFLPGQSPAARLRTPHGRRWGTGDTPAEAKTCPEYACSKSLPKSQERKKERWCRKKRKKEGIPKKEQKNGTVKKQNKSGWPPLKKEETVSLPFHRVVSQEQFGTFECGVDAYVWPQELLDVELSDWLAAYLSTKLLLCPGQAISALVSPGRLRVCACVLMCVI